MLVASWWAVSHTTNELLFDTYVNNKLTHGMPSVVVFYYQLATYGIAQSGSGGNFGEFGKSGAIHQSFTHPNLCIRISYNYG